MENNDLVNKYIEKLNTEATDGLKKRLIMEAQLELLQESLQNSDKEWTEKLETLKQELTADADRRVRDISSELERKVEEVKAVYLIEVNNIIEQRKALQEECNELRTSIVLAEGRYNRLLEDRKPSSRKKLAAL